MFCSVSSKNLLQSTSPFMNGTKCGIQLLHCKCYLCTKLWRSGMAWGSIGRINYFSMSSQFHLQTSYYYTVHSQCQDWRGLHPVYLHFEIQSQCKHHHCYPTSHSMVCCLSNTDQFNPGINQHAHRMWLQGQLGWLATIFGVLKGLCNVATRMTFFEDSVLGTEFHWDSSSHPNALPTITQCWTMHESTPHHLQSVN